MRGRRRRGTGTRPPHSPNPCSLGGLNLWVHRPRTLARPLPCSRHPTRSPCRDQFSTGIASLAVQRERRPNDFKTFAEWLDKNGRVFLGPALSGACGRCPLGTSRLI